MRKRNGMSQMVLNTKSSIQLGSKTHVGTLEIGSDYTSEVSFTIPSTVQGNYVLFVVTEAADAIAEEDENNNSKGIPVFINGSADTPADLQIANVTAPGSIKAGDDVTISYTIENVGEYAAAANLHDVIYLSKDNRWDLNDMMVGVVSRLTWQKGFYLLMEQLDALCAAPIQLVILGSGESQIENKFRELENGNKGKICFYYGYNESLAHRIYAASDLFLMPSLFEPCGISQLCSMRYGTLPLVRETGGLKDTVDAYNEYEKSGNGFSFENYDSNELIHTLYYACDVYYNRKEDWKMLQRNALNTDVSWQQSAKTYSLLYDELVD